MALNFYTGGLLNKRWFGTCLKKCFILQNWNVPRIFLTIYRSSKNLPLAVIVMRKIPSLYEFYLVGQNAAKQDNVTCRTELNLEL